MSADAAGLLLLPPYFYRYSENQLLSFYESFAATIGDKVCTYLYNLPFFTNPIGPQLAERLLTSGAFAGIKDSSGDPEMFQALRQLHQRTGFSLLVGSESLYMDARLAGADGIVSGVAAAVPELIVAIERAVLANELERARHLNTRLGEFVEWVNRFPGTVAIKQAAVARGWKLNHFAFPLGPETTADMETFQQWLRSWLPSVLNECAHGASAVRA